MSTTAAEVPQSNMPYVRIGKSGLKVSRLILGCMSYGSPEWAGWVLPEEEGIKHIKAAYDMGINAFDTANLYSNGLSEVILGKAIKQHNLPRDEIVVMTKLWGTVARTTSEALAWASQEELGKNRYTNQQGLSRKNYARQHNLTQFISMQNFHNAIYREEEREMVPLLQDLGVGMIPWSPLARGFLTRKIAEDSVRGQTDQFFKAANVNAQQDSFCLDINAKVAEISEKRGISMAQVALAWSLSKPFVSAPIVGTTSLDKLKDLVEGVSVKLTEDEVKSIDELYRPRAISGHI
ncbi:hypothetical protein FRB90_000770 [Tulasnella sp. 427]|nr:hypothetical protein FRB90_000770 [Tulasnella sp. 427]